MKTLKNKLRIGLFLLLCGLFIMPATVTKAEDVVVGKSKEGTMASYKDKDGKEYMTSFWETFKRDQDKGLAKSAGEERRVFQMSDLAKTVGFYTGAGAAMGAPFAAVGALPGAAVGAAVGTAAFAIEWVFSKEETYEWKDATGNIFKFQIDSSGEAVYADGASEVKGCELLPAKLYKYRECMFCPLFKVIYIAADDITAISINTLSEGFAVVIGLGLAIWIAIQTLAHVSSITKQDAPKFIDTLIRQSFKFLIAFLLLHFHRQMFDYILLPILDTGLTMGRKLLFSDGNDTCALIPFDGIDVAAYGQDLYSNLVCYITVIQREIGFMQALGSSLMCIGGNGMIAGGSIDFGDGFQMALVGFILSVFGFLLSIAFAFYLVDAVVQLGIVGALLPFLIASWPFKATSKYANTGFQMLLNSAFIFVFMGLVVSVNLKLVGASITESSQTSMADRLTDIAGDTRGKNSYGFNTDAITETGALKISNSDDTTVQMGSLSSLYIAINAQNIDELKKLTDLSGMDFLIMLFCCIFGFKFTQQAQSLADKMASGSVSGIAPSIATMGGSAALGMAKKATQAPREAAERKVKQGIGNAYRGAKSFFSRKKGSSSGTGFGKGKSPTVFNQGGVPKKTGQYGSGESNQPQAPITINQGGTTNNSTPLQPKNLAEKRKMEKRFAREYDKSEAGKFHNVMGRANSEAGASKESIKMLRRTKAKSREAYVKARMEGKNQNEAFKAADIATIQTAAADIQEMTGTNVMEMIEGAQKKATPPKKLNANNGSRKGNTRVSRKSRKHGGRGR